MRAIPRQICDFALIFYQYEGHADSFGQYICDDQSDEQIFNHIQTGMILCRSACNPLRR